MKSSEIIKRARSLCDISTASYISNSDELNSLHESWKDIYEKISESSDDYFIKTVELDLSTIIQLATFEYEIAVPVDCWKIRFVDYKYNGRWVNMTKFNTNSRNNNTTPSYRLRNNKLWISGVVPAELRLSYYPAPVKPSVPEMSYVYGSSYTEAQSINITSPYFFSRPNKNQIDVTDYMLYEYNKTLKIESTKLNTIATLYTSTTGITNIKYNLGYIYFIENGNIMKGITDYKTVITPTAITTVNNITNFNITNNLIYFSDATNTYTCNLDGSNITQIYAYVTKDCYVLKNSLYFITANTIYKDGVTMDITASNLVTDTEYLYYVQSNVLKKYISIDSIVDLATDISVINGIASNYIASITTMYLLTAISSKEDTDFSYPVNESNELMAYQCAIDFNRKQKGDITALTLRLNEIIARFEGVLIRDNYQPERRSPEAYSSFYY